MVQGFNDEVCEDLIKTLTEIEKALKQRDGDLLNNLSDHTIHISTIYLEKRTVYIAMISYSLGKIIAKSKFNKEYLKNLDPFLELILKDISELIDCLKNKNFKGVDETIEVLLKEISDFDSSFGSYVQKIIEFARIKKGSKKSSLF